MDIRTKLVLALISTALLSMLMLGYLTYLLSFDLLLQNSGRQLDAIVSSKAREIGHAINAWEHETQRLSKALQAPAADPGQTGQMDSQTFRRVVSETFSDSSNLRWTGLYDVDGALQVTDAPDLALGIWPAGAVKRKPIIRLNSAGQRELLQPVHSQAGLLVAAFAFDRLAEVWTDRSGLGETGELLIVAPDWIDSEGSVQEGYLLLNPSDPQISVAGAVDQAPELFAAALTGSDVDQLQSRFQDRPVIASIRTFAAVPWRVIVKVDASEESARVDELLAEMRSLGLSLGALVIFGGIFFGFYLSRRIRRLADFVERVRHGELDLRAEVEGADEIALLASSFNEFLNQLNRSSDMFQLGALRVLVAEDHAGSRQLLNELLTNWRMRTLLASDGGSALEAIEEAEQVSEPIQLIVLDESMPEMDGVELIEQLTRRKDWVRCPIIMLARDPEALDLEQLKRLGVGHVVAKPVVASDLMEAILEEMGVSARALESIADADLFLTKADPRNVLLVEDSPIIQKVTVGFLERWGHSVTLAGNGLEALQLCKAQRFDLVLMDIEMPVMNGLEAAAAIRDAEPDDDRVPIIALTAKATKEDREECMAAGMNDYVAKPVDPKVLYHLIETHPSRTMHNAVSAPGDELRALEETTVAETDSEDTDEANPERQDPIVDWEVARRLTGGDESLLAELIELFPEESSSHLAAVRAGIAEQDAESLTRGAHSLKSSAGFFGAAQLVSLALEMETLGRAGSLSDAAERVVALEEAVACVTAALKGYSPAPAVGE
jgi:CheY-like chemotaxis protein